MAAGQLPDHRLTLLQKGRFVYFTLTRASWMGIGQRKEQIDGVFPID